MRAQVAAAFAASLPGHAVPCIGPVGMTRSEREFGMRSKAGSHREGARGQLSPAITSSHAKGCFIVQVNATV